VRFLQKRKLKALNKIFPNALITVDTLEKIEKDWTTKVVTKQSCYVVSDTEIKALTQEQTKQIEKKRLRISSIDMQTGKIILQRKLKVFDWFLIYAGMRISFGVLAFYGLVVWLG
jgi:hypothetical protein